MGVLARVSDLSPAHVVNLNICQIADYIPFGLALTKLRRSVYKIAVVFILKARATVRGGSGKLHSQDK